MNRRTFLASLLAAPAPLMLGGISLLSNETKKTPLATGIQFGFRDLDSMGFALRPGNLTVIASRPSMGKTAFAVNLALNTSIGLGVKTAFVSLEMSKESLVTRFLSYSAKVSIANLKKGKFSVSEMDRLIESSEQIAKAPIYIIDDVSLSPQGLAKLVSPVKPDLLIIDYFQLLREDQVTENSAAALNQLSIDLKALARTCNVPVVALSQLDRKLERRKNKRPILADLKHLGGLEREADQVAFLYRDGYYTPQSSAYQTAEIIVAKNRLGQCGPVPMGWSPIDGFSDYDFRKIS
ncbi:MAG: DnaB-like helicase C-terminal domain-containing protein, partial [Bdellovibrionia bacterium]